MPRAALPGPTARHSARASEDRPTRGSIPKLVMESILTASRGAANSAGLSEVRPFPRPRRLRTCRRRTEERLRPTADRASPFRFRGRGNRRLCVVARGFWRRRRRNPDHGNRLERCCDCRRKAVRRSADGARRFRMKRVATGSDARRSGVRSGRRMDARP